MTKEQKDLLLKDLCCRLPYGVVIQDKCLGQCKSFLPNKECDTLIDIDAYSGILVTIGGSFYEVDEMKPYLFPLSSMTEEQEKELLKVYYDEAELIAEHLKSDISGNVHTHRFNHQLSLNWYLKNHFDINGLIPMELAEDATGKNIY